MKIGIITFHAAFNYGSMLQAYALQTYLERLGNVVEIINFRPKSQKKGYPKPISFSNISNLKSTLKRLILAPKTISPLYKKWSLFDEFLHNYLHLTKEYSSFEELEAEKFDYDLVVTGSDQIWNTVAFDFDKAYFGKFLPNSVRKIAYAPSMGPVPESQNAELLKSLLKDYSAISVREERTKEYLVEKGICQNVSVVLDPTMLLEGKDYDEICDQTPLVEGKYIFYYTPRGVRHEFLSEASKIGEILNIPVICDNCYKPGDLKRYSNVTAYPEVGPAEFLNLIKNAELVCGASFHLMVFSILFNKPFYCMNGDVDSRLNNLMTVCGTTNRIWSICHKNKNKLKISSCTNWDNIELMRKYSSAFLRNNIS